MATGWYLLGESDEPVGPVTTDQILRGIRAGKVASTVKVAPTGGAQWVDIVDVPEFSAEFTDAARTTRPAL